MYYAGSQPRMRRPRLGLVLLVFAARHAVAGRARRRPGRRRPSCAGRATPKAARRLSRRIRRTPTSSSASTSRSPSLLARGLGRTPRFVQVAVLVDRSVDRPRRRRHRAERHRGHAGPPRDARADHSRTTSSARCSRVRTADAARFRTLADLARPPRRHARRHHRLRHPAPRRARSRPRRRLVRRRRASVQRSAARAPRRRAARQRARRAAPHGRMGGFVVEPRDGRDRPLRRRARGAERAAARRDERDPAPGDARRHARAASCASGASGTTTSRRSTRACSPASPSRRSSASTNRRASPRCRAWEAARRYLPSLLQASVVTIVLSCGSMALAVALGVLIASGRVYGARAAARRCSPATSS